MKLKSFLLSLVVLLATAAFSQTTKFDSKDFNFSATFPNKVEVSQKPPDYIQFVAVTDDITVGCMVGVITEDFSKLVVNDDTLRNLYEGFLEGLGSGMKVDSVEKGIFQGYPTVFITGVLTNNKGISIEVHTMLIVAQDKNHIFSVLGMVTKGADASRAEVFMKSFTII